MEIGLFGIHFEEKENFIFYTKNYDYISTQNNADYN